MQVQTSSRPRPALGRDVGSMVTDVLDDELQLSTSAETICHLPLHLTLPSNASHTSRPSSPSQPSSPHSSLPSPSSPSGDSVSSFPSVSSSFLFSSGPGSPPHPAHHFGNESEHEQADSSLIIPSLTLPTPLRRPTPYGQGLGEVRLLVLTRKDVGIANIVDAFTEEECEDIVDTGQWEDFAPEDQSDVASTPAKVLRISTDWIEHRDAHGLEKHEPSRNLEIVHLSEYDVHDDPAETIRATLTYIQSPFRSVLSVVHPDQPPNDLLAALLSSPTTPLYTAMVVVSSDVLTPFEHTLIVELSTHIPIIIIPPLPDPSRYQHFSSHAQDQAVHPSAGLNKARLSSIRPPSTVALRDMMLHHPETLATLRLEATDRFLRWREVERAVGRLLGSPDAEFKQSLSGAQRTTRENTLTAPPPVTKRRSDARWDRSRWEAEWEDALSTDVAKTLRARRSTERRMPVNDYFTPTTPMPRPNPPGATNEVTESAAFAPQGLTSWNGTCWGARI
ncbi:hypothetical protein NM688_g4056 [Phlebia brevispora]|uniref:Uncharacterized protein n=1 Tax=Phlebia brevispora TaxID=194682 RepID=A0ACC1T477_9APHY|nr:hypothetical protein NM688_g4056 [Phlebia brevispora]